MVSNNAEVIRSKVNKEPYWGVRNHINEEKSGTYIRAI